MPVAVERAFSHGRPAAGGTPRPDAAAHYHPPMPNDPVTIPDHVRALLGQPWAASVATLDPDGGPRQAVAWYRLDDDGRILLNSADGRRWPANLRRDGRVALTVVDPADAFNFVALTAVVEEVVEGDRARDDIVALAHRYIPGGPSAQVEASFRSQPRVSFLARVTGLHDHVKR